MKISTKGRYGLEALADLAIHSDGGPVNLRDISERCSISHSYMLQIFPKLRRADIVKSIRGAQGGYLLSREASDITVLEILEALEGSLAPVECLSDRDSCCRVDICPTRGFWNQLWSVMNETAASVSLGDIVECYAREESSGPASMDFFI